MGTFVFRWPHAAEEVHVTGTFDNWTKSEELEKVGDGFEKEVTLADADKKIYYKFVVDGNWITDHTAPQEKDHEGNDNNVLLPEQISRARTENIEIMNTVGPGATTAALAGEVPLEVEKEKEVATMNTVGPDATTATLAGEVPLETSKEKETPGAELPGAFPETPAADLNKPISINPLPAANGAVNPINLAPGEKIPDEVKANGLHSHVKLDEESYEKSDTLAGVDISQIPPVTSNLVPESSLPIVGAPKDVAIQSVGLGATTMALAGRVPLEKDTVPEVVQKSQEKAGVDAEASAFPTEVEDKAQVEKELLAKVPAAPSTAEGTSGLGTEKSESDKTLAETVTAAVATAGAAALGATIVTKDAIAEHANTATPHITATALDTANKLPESVQQALPSSIQDAMAGAKRETTREAIVPGVPAEVKESIIKANKDPEAAASTVAVEEKKAVEAELLQEVKPIKAVDESSAAKKGPNLQSAANGEADAAVSAPEVVSHSPAKSSTAAALTEPGTSSPAKAVATDSTSTSEKRKKHRISSFFSKLKPGKKDGKA